MRYDIAIVGTGPAGISAALTAKSRNKRILLIGSAKGSEKIGKTHMIVNYPGVPEVTGPELNRRLLDQVKAAGIPITEKRVAGIYAMGDYFSLQADQDFLEASSVILTTGTSFGKPDAASATAQPATHRSTRGRKSLLSDGIRRRRARRFFSVRPAQR